MPGVPDGTCPGQALLACGASGEPSGKADIQTPRGSGSEVRDLAIDVHADAARDSDRDRQARPA